jgi:hypothetical protein
LQNKICPFLGLLKKNEKKLAQSINFTFRYMDDVISLNNSRFGDFVYRIYPIEFEIKNTTDTDRSASYLDLHLETDSEERLRTKLYDKSCLVRIKEQVGDKRSTVCTHRHANSLVKNTSTKHSKYVVNKKNSSMLMI